MNYNDEFEVLGVGQFEKIAKEYNESLKTQRVESLSQDDRSLFDEAMTLAGALIRMLEKFSKQSIKASKMYEAVRLNNRHLAEFYYGEFGERFLSVSSVMGVNERKPEIVKAITELIKKLIRIHIKKDDKRQIFYNIIDDYIQLFEVFLN